jgi:hypothetical protein
MRPAFVWIKQRWDINHPATSSICNFVHIVNHAELRTLLTMNNPNIYFSARLTCYINYSHLISRYNEGELLKKLTGAGSLNCNSPNRFDH